MPLPAAYVMSRCAASPDAAMLRTSRALSQTSGRARHSLLVRPTCSSVSLAHSSGKGHRDPTSTRRVKRSRTSAADGVQRGTRGQAGAASEEKDGEMAIARDGEGWGWGRYWWCALQYSSRMGR